MSCNFGRVASRSVNVSASRLLQRGCYDLSTLSRINHVPMSIEPVSQWWSLQQADGEAKQDRPKFKGVRACFEHGL